MLWVGVSVCGCVVCVVDLPKIYMITMQIVVYFIKLTMYYRCETLFNKVESKHRVSSCILPTPRYLVGTLNNSAATWP